MKIRKILLLLLLVFMVCGCTKNNENVDVADEEIYYTVQFVDNTEFILPEIKVKAGETVDKPSDPKKDNYTFVKWNYMGEEYNFNKPVESNIILEAEWMINEEQSNTIDEAKKEDTSSSNSSTSSNKSNNKSSKSSNSNTSNSNNKSTSKTESDLPTVKAPTLSFGKGAVGCDWVTIMLAGEYATGHSTISGWELYEKVNNSYNLIGENTTFNSIKVETDYGEEKTIVARVYLIYNGKKVYSPYSNILNLSNPVLTPTLSVRAGSPGFVSPTVIFEGEYATDHSNISGWELYEKVNGSYNLIGTNTTFELIKVEIDYGEEKTIVARVYSLNKNNQKVYSGYSNALNVSNPVLTPTLSFANMGSQGSLFATVILAGEYATDHSDISGWELYEKVNGSYNLIGTNTTFESINVLVASGEEKTIVARVYSLNKNSQKVYSGYSNELLLTNIE